ncbi:MAG TPA: hypothetical protein VFH48_34255 [Chloroflexota bacterium]|nr:hypothetical protein [Chloroflexota bacterium]
MLAIFSSSIRGATLALAAAAIACTTVTSTIAAAPAESLPRPTGSEIAAADPSKLDLPKSDIQVWGANRSGDRDSVEYYNFRVKNLGPDPARVKVKREATAFSDANGRVVTADEEIYVIGVNNEWYLSVTCHAPADGECYGGKVTATVMNGIDPNLVNNSSSWDWGQ